jgi:hypothetical protein
MEWRSAVDDDYEYSSDARCVECAARAEDTCVCGAPLCLTHIESQAGFCSNVMDDAHVRIFKD